MFETQKPGYPFGSLTRRVGGKRGFSVIILGVVLLVLGFIFAIKILWAIGIVVLVIGLVLVVLGATGRAVRGRRHYY